MMIKVFTTDKDGKIVLSGKELKELLDEAYWEGYKANTTRSWTYTTPSWTPFYYTTTASGSSTISLSNEAKSASSDSITINGGDYTVKGTGLGSNNVYTSTSATASL